MQTSKLTIQNLLSIKKPLIMGILNITPDSFSDGGKYFNFEDAINHAKKLIKDGADIIDIGGESTRPGAAFVLEEEELRRVVPVIQELAKQRWGDRAMGRKNEFLISIDTYKSNVARLALEAGTDMINDVSGLTKDPDMVKVAANAMCPIVIMHNGGIPATKPETAIGRDGGRAKGEIEEVYNWLKNQTDFAIKNGVKHENIIIDPGIGFGKTAEEDLALIENLQEFKSLGFRILVGTSRKLFIKKLFGKENFERKNKEMTELAIKNEADIVRVHEVF